MFKDKIFKKVNKVVSACLVMSDSLRPYSLLCPWDSPGKNTGVGCHFLIQGIFLTQGANLALLCLLHWQMDSQSCPTLCDPMDCSTPGLPEFTQLMFIESMMSSNQLNLCRHLLLPPSIFPSIRIFSNESVLHIKRPKYQSFSFNNSPYNEYSRLISFRMD